MPDTFILRKLMCLLACQPRDLENQLAAALECFCAACGAAAAGIYWPDATGALQPRVSHPAGYRFDLTAPARPCAADPTPIWLAAPMKVGGETVGRLWAVAPPSGQFSAEADDLSAMTANQLALAIENARLTDDVQHLAARRGELLRRVIATQDERCRRVSRELHDEISQSLTAMALDLEAMEVAGKVTDHAALERLGNLRGRLLAALDEVNRIILDLRPTLLEDLGLVPALRWYATQRLAADVRLHVQADGMSGRLSPHIETTLYRIAQEAITNVSKHAHAHNVWLDVHRRDGHFELSIQDDGAGCDLAHILANPDNRVGIGLFGMRERATLAGGACDLRSALGAGTRVYVRIPVEMRGNDGADSRIAG